MAPCQAKRTNGEPCKAQAVHGKRVCRVHGGMTPNGIASPHYKTGRYSKVLPARLAARYQEARQDTALLELREEISLTDTRLSDLLARVDTGESGALWRSLMDARMDLIAAKRANDTIGQMQAVNAIMDLISQGHTDYRAWTEIGQVLEQRRKLVESERKRLIEAQQVITAEQAIVFVNAVLLSVREHVSDRSVLSAIQNDMTRLLNRQPDVIDVSTTE